MLPRLSRYYKEIIIAILVIIIVVLGVLLLNKKETTAVEPTTVNDISYTSPNEEEKEEVKTKIKVDIKGAVSKPGVYEVLENSVVNDVIKLAGGLKKGAVTSNINLSKKLEPEMVIQIFTANELKKQKKDEDPSATDTICQENTIIIDKCKEETIIKDVDTPNSNDVIVSTEKKDNVTNKKEDSTPKIISINTASIDELVTLPGIGESKAVNIIKYREEHGAFKTIEEITNVSGIGESAYNKIKDFITV